MASNDAARIKAIRQLLDRIEGRIGTAFLQGVQSARDDLDLKELQNLIERGRYEQASEYVTQSLYKLGFFKLADAITHAVIEAGQLAARYAHVEDIAVRFDIVNPKTAAYLRNYTADLIREITTDTRRAVSRMIREGVLEGFNPKKIAVAVRDTIGLTQTQERAVANYRTLLENLDASALDRALRDKRFDPAVERAIREQQAMTPEKIDSMVGRYRDRYVSYRAQTIARTEAIRANSTGNQQLWQQAVDDGKVRTDELRRFWINTKDGRTREAHLHIPFQNVDGVGFNQPFKSDLGPILYPGDPNAVAANVINCRCAFFTRIVKK